MKGKAVTQPDTKESLAGASFTCEVTSAETVVDSSKRKEKFTVSEIVCILMSRFTRCWFALLFLTHVKILASTHGEY